MTRRKSYIWLQEDETCGQAVCGCFLENGGLGPAFWLCPLHEAAPLLLEACKLAKKALDLNDEFGDDMDARHAAEEEAWHLLSEATRKAESSQNTRRT